MMAVWEIASDQWPVPNINWELNPNLRGTSPFFSKWANPIGMLSYHKDVGVNPWKHRAVRMKHFAHAAHRADCKALDAEWIATSGSDYGRRYIGNSVVLHDESHTYQIAMRNCTW
jgi:hypothetical protein